MKLSSSYISRGGKCLVAVAWLASAGVVAAAPIKLASLVSCECTYSNVTVLTFNSSHVCFSHKGGVSSLKLKYLDAKAQALFGYDAALAAEAEKQAAAADALYMQGIVSNLVAQAERMALAAQRQAITSEDNLADPVSKISLIGKPAPKIKGDKWLGEKPDCEGKAMLVAFWEPWSIPCRKYLPTLDGFQRRFEGKLAVVGVTSEQEDEEEETAQTKMEFASLLDPKAQLSATVGVTSVPYVMLVDTKGVVRYQGHPSAITDKQLENLLAKAAL